MVDQGNKNVYVRDVGFGYGMNHMYGDDSGVTYNSRKRSRDSSYDNVQFMNGNELDCQKGMVTFLGQDVSMQIYQQQVEIDRLIANHMERVRLVIEATPRRNSMRLIAIAEEGIRRRLRSKDDEIIKISKLNYKLEEKIKSLNVENQIYQQMAQTNEATANVLRLNLQQILAQIQQQKTADSVEDDESCCGSNYDENHDNDATTTLDNNGNRLNRLCRNCGKVESCVLLLPCRHLCVCSMCESSSNVCPICKSFKNASVHVNVS